MKMSKDVLKSNRNFKSGSWWCGISCVRSSPGTSSQRLKGIDKAISPSTYSLKSSAGTALSVCRFRTQTQASLLNGVSPPSWLSSLWCWWDDTEKCLTLLMLRSTMKCPMIKGVSWCGIKMLFFSTIIFQWIWTNKVSLWGFMLA